MPTTHSHRRLSCQWIHMIYITLTILSVQKISHACEVLTAPDNGFLTAEDGFGEGATVTFSCDVSYSLIGSPSTTCNNGSYSRPVPSCVLDCSDPGSPVDGSQEGSPTYQAYTTVSFVCDSGFGLVGAPTITCNGGTWTLPVPECVANCADPGTPSNGTQVGSPTYLQGTTVSFECDPGFTLIGASVISCEDGRWNRETPTCAADCTDPGTPADGSQSGSYGNGDTVTFTCEDTFTLVGASIISCLGGDWSDEIPICYAQCGDPGAFENGIKSGGVEYGDTLSYVCVEGYTLVGASEVTCTSNDWDTEPPVCYKSCTDPGTPSFGSQSGTYEHGDIVEFTCDSGYTLVGASQITCEDGTFSAEAPVCQADCTDPGTPANAAQSGSYGNGDTVTFTCDATFTLVGASILTCLGGPWSNEVPECIAACGDPGTFENGNKTGGVEYGDTLTYVCDDGYTLVGASELTCTSTGWDTEPPVCYRNCEDPGTPAFGSQSGTYDHGDVLTFECNEFYTLIGASQITCDDGTYNADIPVCEGDISVSTDSPAGTTQRSKPTTVAAATTEQVAVTTTPTSKVTSDKGTTSENRLTTTIVTTDTPFRETTPEVDVDTTRPEPSTRPPQQTTLGSSSRPPTERTTRDSPATVAEATTKEAVVTTTVVATTSDTGTTSENGPPTTQGGRGTTETRETTPIIDTDTTRPEPPTRPPRPTRPEPPTRPPRPTSPSVSTRPLPESTTRDYFSQYTTREIEPSTRPRPMCQPIMAPIHGSYTRYEWYHRGEKIVFSCLPNYVLIGPEWIVCIDGEWSGPVPECKITCGRYPPPPIHGYTLPPDRYLPSHPSLSTTQASLPDGMRGNHTLTDLFEEAGEFDDVPGRIGALNFPNLGIGNPFMGGDEETVTASVGATEDSGNGWPPIGGVDLPNIDIPFIGGGDSPSGMVTFSPGFTLPTVTWEGGIYPDDPSNELPDIGNFNTRAVQVLQQIIDITMEVDWQIVDSESFLIIRVLRELLRIISDVIMTSDWENGDLSTINWENMNSSALPMPGMLRDGLTMILSTDWQNYDWTSLDFSQLTIPNYMREIMYVIMDTDWSTVANIPEILQVIQRQDFTMGDLPNIDLSRINTTRLSINIDVLRLLGTEFLANGNVTNVNWEAMVGIINSNLPEGFPTIRWQLEGTSLPFFDWTTMNVTALPLPGNIRQAITMVMSWENINWLDMSAIPEFIRELILLFITTDTEDIGADDILPILPIPDGIRDMITMAMNFDWERVNMTGINNMPVPTSASDLIAIVSRILRQNPVDWNILQNYTGLDMLNMYNMSLTDMPIPDVLRPYLSILLQGGWNNTDWRDFNMTFIPYGEFLRPYLHTLMTTDWENFDWNNTDFRNMSLPDPLRNILEFVVSTDWENLNTDRLESLMPLSLRNILFIARHVDMTTLQWIDFMLPLLPLPDYVKDWIEMARNFNMPDLDVNQMNMTALLPEECREFILMLMNIDLESIRLSNVTDFIMPSQVREFLHFLNGTDWSRYNSTDILMRLPVPDQVKSVLFLLVNTDWETVDQSNINKLANEIYSMMMNLDLELLKSLNFNQFMNATVPQYIHEMLQQFMHIDWENFYWTNENITNLPIPPAASRFLIMVMRTDWQNIDWNQIDLSALSIPDQVKSFIFNMTNMRWEAVNWTSMVDNLPIPQGNREILGMLMAADIQEFILELLNQLMTIDWGNFEWMNDMPEMDMETVDWSMILDVLNLPISGDLRNTLLMMLTTSKENWDMSNFYASMLPDQLSEFLYLLESMDWENIDLMQAIDLMNFPIPDQIKDLLMMMAHVDWESFDWMNMDFTVLRELLGIFINMDLDNIELSNIVDLSGLPISDDMRSLLYVLMNMDWNNPDFSNIDLSVFEIPEQMRMYLEMLMTIDWENFEWSNLIDISGLPEPIKALIQRMMSMDWENMDMTELPMPDQLRMYIMMITELDWANFDWNQVIDFSGLPIPDQLKLFLEMLLNMDWTNMNWEQIDLSMVPMPDQIRELLELMMVVEWQTIDWTQVIDLSGLPISNETKLFLYELMSMDWENPDWSQMDFSRLPISPEMRDMLYMMLTMDWNAFDWTQVIDLSGLPISDQMKLAIHWMMRMDWGNTDWMDMDSMMERIMAFVYRVDSIISNILHQFFYDTYHKMLKFLFWLDLPFLPDLPRPLPRPIAGDSITYVCKRGFELFGSSVLTCTNDGSWSSSPPVCKRIRPTEPPRPTGRPRPTTRPRPTERPRPSEPLRTTPFEFTTGEESTTQNDRATTKPPQTTKEATTEGHQRTTIDDEATTPRLNLQTTSDVATSAVVTTEEVTPAPTTPADPCSSNPCVSDVNTDCVSMGDTYSCQCQAGYTRDSNNTCTSTQQFAAMIRITEVNGGTASFTEDLQDTTSPAFQSLAADVENTLDMIYLMSSLADSYLGATVNGFSNGSIVVDYTVKFKEEEPTNTNATSNTTVSTPIDSTTVVTAFTESLKMAMEMGTVNVSIDESSVMVTDLDECASPDDNNCDDNAACINTEGSFTCRCNDGFIDLSQNIRDQPGRACSLPVTTPTMPPPPPNPCSRDPCAFARAECIVVGRSFKCVCRPGLAFNTYGVCELTCGPVPYPPRYGYAVLEDTGPPGTRPPTTSRYPDGMKGNESTPGWEWPVTRDLFRGEFTTDSTDFWRDDVDESGNVGGIASRLGSLNFPNLGVGNPFEAATSSEGATADSGNGGFLDGLPNVDLPNVDIPAVGIPNTEGTQIMQNIIDIIMAVDWQSTNLGSFNSVQLLRRIIEAVLEVITNIDWENSDLSNMNWTNINITVLHGMLPTIDDRTLDLVTAIGRDFLSNMNGTDVNWEATITALNSRLPEYLPRIHLSTNGSSDVILDWSNFNMTSLPLPDNVRQAITMVMDWQSTNWSDVSAIPEFIRELIILFITTDTEDIGADDVLPILPIPDGFRDMITMVMNFDWERVNMTGINDMPVPTSASDLITIVSRILRQNPVDWNLLRNYTGIDLMNMYNMSMADMPIPNALRLYFLGWRDMNMTDIPYVELLRPYLHTLMTTDWDKFDWNSTDFINMSLPDPLGNILEFVVSTDWQNLNTDRLESLMPVSLQNILFIARHVDMTTLEWVDFMLPLLPLPDYVKDWIEMARNFNMSYLDVNQMNMTTLLPGEWREYILMLMNIDLESIRLSNVTDFLMPSQVREFLLLLNGTDWNNYNSTKNFLMSLPLPDQIRNIIMMVMETDWDSFDTSFDTISNLPIPDQVKVALYMFINTDWETVDWSSIDIGNIVSLMMNMGWELSDGSDFFEMLNESLPQYVQELLEPFIDIDWENFYWTNENITNLPIPAAASRFLIMLMRTDWQNIDWNQINLTALSIPDQVKTFIFAMRNIQWEAANWTGMVDNLHIPLGNGEILRLLMDADVQQYILELLNQLMMMDWENFDWMNAMPGMEMEAIDWSSILDMLNLPISEDLKNTILIMLTTSRENWDLSNLDTSMLPDQLTEFLYLLESMDWENIDLMQAIDLMNLPIPDQIKDLLMMMAHVDWERFDWMNMDFTVLRELLAIFMNMDLDNIEWSNIVDLSGLPITDQMRMYLEMLMTIDWENFEFSNLIDISGLPEPIRALIEMMMSMDWENMDMTELPMPDQLRMFIMIITEFDWTNFDWNQAIDFSGLPIPDQLKLFLEMLMNMDWTNMNWEQIDLSMIPMPDQIREVLELMMVVDWQNVDWTGVIDLSGLPFSDETKLFLYELMRMDWENTDWSQMDFSRLPLSPEMRDMLYMMLTVDWNEFDWTRVIDLSGLPISDQMKLAIHWMMKMDWENTDWMDMDMSNLPVPQQVIDFLTFINGIDWQNFDWVNGIDLSDLPLPEPFKPIMSNLWAFTNVLDTLISNLIHEVVHETYWKFIHFLKWLDLPFLPDLPQARPLAFVGDSVTYICKDGFELVGMPVLRCTADGSFSGMRPICIRIIPTRPPRPTRPTRPTRPPRPTMRPRPTLPPFEPTTDFEFTTSDFMVSTTDQSTPRDPCSSRPCAWDPNTVCVSRDDMFMCRCQPGYSRDSDDICILTQQFAGAIRITETNGRPALFTEDLRNTASPGFRALAIEVENTLDMVYRRSSIANLYLGSEINSFANGSIVVDYTVKFSNEGMMMTESSTVTNAFMDSLRTAMEMGTINITIDESSVRVTDLDECISSGDNNCDDDAVCINTEGSFTCRCNDGFIDLSPDIRDQPGRNCSRNMMSPRPTRPPRPTDRPRPTLPPRERTTAFQFTTLDLFEKTTVLAEVTTRGSEQTTETDSTTKEPQRPVTERPDEVTTDGIDIVTTRTTRTTEKPRRSTDSSRASTESQAHSTESTTLQKDSTTGEVRRMVTTDSIVFETTTSTTVDTRETTQNREATTQAEQTTKMATEENMVKQTTEDLFQTTQNARVTTQPEATTKLSTTEGHQTTLGIVETTISPTVAAKETTPNRGATTQAPQTTKMTTDEKMVKQTTEDVFQTTGDTDIGTTPAGKQTTQNARVTAEDGQTTPHAGTTDSRHSTTVEKTTNATTTLAATTRVSTEAATTKASTTDATTKATTVEATEAATTKEATTRATTVETTAAATTKSTSTLATTIATTLVSTTEAQTKEATTPVDPCSSDPCVSDVNTDCITTGDSYVCECQAGYTRDSNNTCISIQQFNAMIRITEVNGGTAAFTEDLQNTTSLAFQSLAADVENTLDMIFMMSTLADTYLGVTINGFSEGSIVVDYTVNFKNEETAVNATSNSTSTSSPFINSTLIMTAFTDSLMMAMETGTINVTIDEMSIMVIDLDECASSTDNNCDDDATCTNTEGSFSCQCNFGFIDQSPSLPGKPGRLCVAPTTPPAPTTNDNAATTPVTMPTTPTTPTTLGDPCSSDPCVSVTHSTCVVIGTSYECQCRPGFALNNRGRCRPVNQFLGSCRITRFRGVKAAFSTALSSSSTQEFVALAADVKETLKTIYQYSVVANRYIDIVVDSFRNGSIVVDYRVELEDDNTTLANSSRVSAAFTQSLEETVQNGIVDVTIDENSITVHDYNECLLPEDNNCADNAECINTEGSFTCRCNDELIDTSADPSREPGRSCREPGPCPSGLPNTCSPGAICMEDAAEGYRCQCMNEFLDVSPFPSLPGRICEEICPDGYCENGGTCVAAANGSLCNCAGGYTGVQCEIAPPGQLQALVILGIALGAVVFVVIVVILVVFCCAMNKQRSRYRESSSKHRGGRQNSRPRFFHDPDWDPIDERSEDSLSNAAYDVAASSSAMMEDEERSQRIAGAMGQLPEFESSIHRINNQPVYYARHQPRLMDMGATEFRRPYVASGDELGYMDSRYVPGRNSPRTSSSVTRNPHAIAPTIDRSTKPRGLQGPSAPAPAPASPPPPPPPPAAASEVHPRSRRPEKSISVNLVPIIDPMGSP